MIGRLLGFLIVLGGVGFFSEKGFLIPSLQMAAGMPLSSEKIEKNGSSMIVIPAGPFLMGVPKWARDGGRDEYPNHEVNLPTYAMDPYEVSNGHYLEFIRETGHRAPKHPHDATKNLWQDGLMPESIARLPVVNVDWFDANAYCHWTGKRLPTEAEWEKAGKGTDDRRFPWGNVEPTHHHLNFNQQWRGEHTLTPGGMYELGKSPYGLSDMAGNVWEWVADWYDATYYQRSPRDNPQGPDQGQWKVIRSSGWQVETPQVRIFTRVASDPYDRNHSTGFRCAADSSKP